MTSTYQNSPSTTFFQAADHEVLHHQNFIFYQNNYQDVASSSSSLTTHNFFCTKEVNDLKDQAAARSYYYDHKETQIPQVQQDEADNFASRGGSYDHIEYEKGDHQSGRKSSIWKKEDHKDHENHEVKWMSSKMRLMHKMKKVDPTVVKTPPINTSTSHKLEDQKQQSSTNHMETELSSNSTSSNNMNPPIMVCSDCSTTKTPLWRSGPQGPKTLCNACGIRQRKARRAMAAAEASGTTIQTKPAVLLKTTKTQQQQQQQKDKRPAKHGIPIQRKQYKNRGKKLLAVATTISSSSHHHLDHQIRKKLCLEEFLLSLSKNLAFHGGFPQDMKEAAILLMALSCGGGATGHFHG